jgi:Activator of Hsp90 ATPase homolog 1-like protein
LTFEIEPLGDLAKLTMIHDGFAPGSVVLPGISDGWPRVLAGLKTLLETGETLPAG